MSRSFNVNLFGGADVLQFICNVMSLLITAVIMSVILNLIDI